MPYWEDLKWNDLDDVDGPGDVGIPKTAHHMQAKAEIDILIQEGALDHDEGERALEMWKAEQQMGDETRSLGAIAILEERGVIDEEEAEDLRGRASTPA